jgi:cytochrome c oxidase cbb3-type subunit 2
MIGQVVVPTPAALDLVKYLQGMDHTYPVLPPDPQPVVQNQVVPNAK